MSSFSRDLTLAIALGYTQREANMSALGGGKVVIMLADSFTDGLP